MVDAMLNVYFENSYGKRRLIGTAPTYQGANQVISSFLKAYDYHSYYWNVSEVDGETRVDVGSWSEFFYIKPDTED